MNVSNKIYFDSSETSCVRHNSYPDVRAFEISRQSLSFFNGNIFIHFFVCYSVYFSILCKGGVMVLESEND